MNKSMLPNLFTFANLSFGMLAILLTLTDSHTLAAIMIACAGFVDRYDGKIARKFNASSPIGKELDSLADLVSFGAAPAVLSWSTFLSSYGIIGYIITILFPIAGAYRLARYNVTEFEDVFMGVPITIAGGIIALDIIIATQVVEHNIISSGLMLLLSYLMISKVKIQKR
jgi:CDP-diacylglycerol---serine O-phosphatidyltransferase